MIGRSKPILLSAGALGALALVVVVPASAQEEEPFACPMPGDIAACQIQVPQPGMLHLVLHTHGKPGALLRVYGPDSVLLGEATAEGVQDPALDLPAPVAGVYLARDEGPGRAQDTPPIDLAVGFAGRAAADGSMQVPAESAADSASAPPAELPYYVSNGTAALLLVSLDPAPVTQLRHPLCEMIQAIGGSSNSCPPGRSLINANVSADFESGYTLVAIALLDRDDTPAVPAPGPRRWTGRRGLPHRDRLRKPARHGPSRDRHASAVSGHSSQDHPAAGAAVRAPAHHRRVFQLGACHAEVASAPYPIAPWAGTARPNQSSGGH